MLSRHSENEIDLAANVCPRFGGVGRQRQGRGSFSPALGPQCFCSMSPLSGSPVCMFMYVFGAFLQVPFVPQSMTDAECEN